MQRADDGRRGVRATSTDAWQLTLDYLKQETIGPLKGTGWFLVIGLLGAVVLSIGLILLLLGLLRLLQEETGTALTGNWSWVPYLAVVAVALVVLGLAAWRVAAGPARRRLPSEATEGGSQS